MFTVTMLLYGTKALWISSTDSALSVFNIKAENITGNTLMFIQYITKLRTCYIPSESISYRPVRKEHIVGTFYNCFYTFAIALYTVWPISTCGITNNFTPQIKGTPEDTLYIFHEYFNTLNVHQCVLKCIPGKWLYILLTKRATVTSMALMWMR